jgi:thioredoxin reductase (NADPH)
MRKKGIPMADKFDVIVIGGGPAGISAALTLRHRNKTVAVIANPPETTNLWKAREIGNYPGITGPGSEIERAMRRQLSVSGAEIISGRALSVMPMGGAFGVAVGNDFYQSAAVILAAGITRENAYPGENEFLGKGVSYCATCDGMLYKGKSVAVVGAGEEARTDGKFLESIGCAVEYFDGFSDIEIKGGEKADTVVSGGKEYKVDCVFILKETISLTKLVPGVRYEDGRIIVDGDMATSVPGVFAAGDCTGKPFQLAKAVGEGNAAALSASRYTDEKNI